MRHCDFIGDKGCGICIWKMTFLWVRASTCCLRKGRLTAHLEWSTARISLLEQISPYIGPVLPFRGHSMRCGLWFLYKTNGMREESTRDLFGPGIVTLSAQKLPSLEEENLRTRCVCRQFTVIISDRFKK